VFVAAFVLPCIIIAVVAAVSLWLRVRRARAAGASDAAPCCVRCWYPLGGWSGSTCPECGADARALGVANGPRFGRALALVLALCTAGGALALGLVLARRFDPVAVGTVQYAWVSETSGVKVRYGAQYGGPVHSDQHGASWARGILEVLPLKSTPAHATDPALVTLHSDAREDPLTIDEVRGALMHAVMPADPSAIEAEAAALHEFIAGFERVVLEQTYERDQYGVQVDRLMPWSLLSGRGEFRLALSARGWLVATLAAASVLAVGIIVAVRCLGWGTRGARDGEWASVGRGAE
jgi:hypothetical protein